MHYIMHYLMHRVAARAPPCENPSTTGGEASTLNPRRIWVRARMHNDRIAKRPCVHWPFYPVFIFEFSKVFH